MSLPLSALSFFNQNEQLFCESRRNQALQSDCRQNRVRSQRNKKPTLAFKKVLDFCLEGFRRKKLSQKSHIFQKSVKIILDITQGLCYYLIADAKLALAGVV